MFNMYGLNSHVLSRQLGLRGLKDVKGYDLRTNQSKLCCLQIVSISTITISHRLLNTIFCATGW